MGRPRRVTLDLVIDAACELGLDRFEMTAVAERLGVGVATLYGYVRDRGQLVELAASRCNQRKGIADRGQSWQELLREHAAISFKIYTTWPEVIGLTMAAAVGSHSQTTPMDGLLSLLMARGLDPRDAFELVYEVNQIVVGAAVGLAYRQSLATRAGGYDAMLASVLNEHAPGELSALRRCLEATGTPDSIGDYRGTLERVLSAHETRLAGAQNPKLNQQTI